MKNKDTANPKFIQERITELRLSKNISEYQMSKDLGRSKGYIQSITSGNNLPSISAFYKICDYFQVSPKEFFDDGSVPDSELVQNLMSEIRRLPVNEQYYLYRFLLARKHKRSTPPLS